ncbi:Sphingoid long-chain base kinase [Komagataella phaffii CBS 7435]|uniref:Sphingoid long-chain base kinase n=1 Tax=Komagataella phaffii (strain ATCC 76273 / CBS 7435 / CECT 11047 / NRRL Y-11430 / Wegner 21-1) TaxID=981350 RepID=F2QWI8_KOMPC|nr:GQ67_03467T0 [Komagataella phaffii]CAH2449798.1 Sphingoid long-chain base kinase [Komagataella phaffii CBS 7435]CCA39766.1 Sphingoid long-chain base kinase [Komagataella phaffii CBS 7435]
MSDKPLLQTLSRAIITQSGIQLSGNWHESNYHPLFCCSGSSSDSSIHRTIPYHDILFAEELDSSASDGDFGTREIELTYVARNNKIDLKKEIVIVTDYEPNLSQTILQKAYGQTDRTHPQRILVLINPHGGKGKALRLFEDKAEPILNAAQCEYEVCTTLKHQHATELIRTRKDILDFDTIVCASGDGIPHEVINGLYQRDDRAECFEHLTVTQIPCGSGNAMSLSCLDTNDPAEAALSVLKAPSVRIDLMAITQPSQPVRLSFLSLTYGMIADGDIGTEWLRFLGPFRFEVGIVTKLLQNAKYPCDLSVDFCAKDHQLLSQHYCDNIKSDYSKTQHLPITDQSFELKSPSLENPPPTDWERLDSQITDNLSIFYVGKMPIVSADTNFFPAAIPDDGCMDLVITDNRSSVLDTANLLLQVDKGTHVLQKDVIHSKVKAFRLTPRIPKGYISVDGESFPFETTQVEVLPTLLKTVMKEGTYAETGFPSYS